MDTEKIANRVAGRFMRGAEQWSGQKLMNEFKWFVSVTDLLLKDVLRLKELDEKWIEMSGKDVVVDAEEMRSLSEELDGGRDVIARVVERLEKMRGVPAMKVKSPTRENPKVDVKGRNREESAAEVMSVLRSALKRAGGFMTENPEVDSGGASVTGAYRSMNIPKESGGYDYDDIVASEVSRFSKILNPMLAGVAGVKGVSIDPQEKSWIYVTIELK